jgi:pSer/pThr/pTyr-binding forkhead associated (FHA) protein
MRRRSVTPERGPRPPLGVLILEDGAAVAVDGDYVVGRDPARDEAVSAGDARPLRVVDAESTVSRIHAGVHLDGWQVLLTDLGSANGTRIRQPGAKVEQLLDPRVPVPLQPGAQIFVGASCLRYERAGG